PVTSYGTYRNTLAVAPESIGIVAYCWTGLKRCPFSRTPIKRAQIRFLHCTNQGCEIFLRKERQELRLEKLEGTTMDIVRFWFPGGLATQALVGMTLAFSVLA